MKFIFTAEEARIIGALLEKEITTPDQYPLSLNALVNACNQKSNRDPVMDLDELTVQNTLDGLKKRHVVGDQVPASILQLRIWWTPVEAGGTSDPL